jgi:glycogen operon protein
MFLNGDAIQSPDPRGQRVVDDSFLLLLNAGVEPVDWKIADYWGDAWTTVLDTAAGAPGNPTGASASDQLVHGSLVLTDRSVVLLGRVGPDRNGDGDGDGETQDARAG